MCQQGSIKSSDSKIALEYTDRTYIYIVMWLYPIDL